MSQKSAFIVFEGIDGSGKTTIVEALKQDYMTQGISCKTTKEPSIENPYGQKIYSILKSTSNKKIDEYHTDLKLLYKQDRVWNLKNNVTPKLNQNHYVIQDRYYISTAAYQALTKEEALEIVKEYLEDPLFIHPSILFFLDLPISKSLERITQRAKQNKNLSIQAFEYKEKLARIYKHYQFVFDNIQFPFPIKKIDASMKQEDVLEFIKQNLLDLKEKN